MSVLEAMGVSASECGYCHAPGQSSISRGMWAHRLTVDDYQELVDRGWRRSGRWLYKPDMERTCCPQYTIRLEATRFAPSREHRRLLRRLSAYMAGSLDLASCAAAAAADGGDGGEGGADRAPARDRPGVPMELSALEGAPPGGGATAAHPSHIDVAQPVAAAVEAAIGECVRQGLLPAAAKYAPPRVVPPAAKVAGRVPAGTVLCCAAAHALAAAAAQAGCGVRPEDVAAALAAALARPGALPPPLRCAASGAFLNFMRAGEDGGEATHPSESERGGGAGGGGGKRRAPRERPAPKEPRRGSPAPPAAGAEAAHDAAAAGAGGVSHPHTALLAGLDVRFVPSAFDAEEYELYCRYQAAVHGDAPSELSRAAYTRFLVATPLLPEAAPPAGGARPGRQGAAASGAPPCGFGSFHQQYRLRGRLVAVGVVDVLPRCLSSKYLFWEPELAPLCLGKYSALADIAWVAAMQAGPCPGLAHYYLGYYIHSCAKMRYKAAFKPSELLCPATRRWVPFAAAAAALDAPRAPPRLAPPDAQPAAEAPPQPERITLFCPGRGVTHLGALAEAVPQQQRDAVEDWARSVGPTVASRAAYVCWLPAEEADGGEAEAAQG